MQLSISTHWNAFRHRSGETLIEEVLALGLSSVELGFDTTMDLVPGIVKMVKDKSIKVSSLHNYCPLPFGAPKPHPEIFTFTNKDPRVRHSAVSNTLKTLEFAQEVGATVVNTHCGRVDMPNYSGKLIELAENGKLFSEEYDKIKTKCMLQRHDGSAATMELLYMGLDSLLPALQKSGIKLGFENLPYWESLPNETETQLIMERYKTPLLGYWHDMGHGQIRQNMGYIDHKRWYDKLKPYLLGLHVHDVMPPASDHMVPSAGKIDFSRFAGSFNSDTVLVLEPAPGTPTEEVMKGIAYIKKVWNI